MFARSDPSRSHSLTPRTTGRPEDASRSTHTGQPYAASSTAASSTSPGAPSRHHAPAREEEQPVGKIAREVQVVAHEHHRHAPLAVEPAEQPDQVPLVQEVEMARRLVEQERPRLLGERPGEERPLPLPAASVSTG